MTVLECIDQFRKGRQLSNCSFITTYCLFMYQCVLLLLFIFSIQTMYTYCQYIEFHKVFMQAYSLPVPFVCYCFHLRGRERVCVCLCLQVSILWFTVRMSTVVLVKGADMGSWKLKPSLPRGQGPNRWSHPAASPEADQEQS